MLDKIMIPLDGSMEAEITLPYAEEIAAKLGAEIILASVSEHVGTETHHLYSCYIEHTADLVRRHIKDWGAREGAKVTGKVLLGKPAPEILRYADEKNVSLITMASRGRSSSGPWVLGDVAAKVLRATGKPVLLIRAPVDNGALREKSLVRRMLVPLDGSKLGELAIPHAETLAKAFGAEVVLFQAFATSVGGAAYDYRSMSSLEFEEEKDRLRKSSMSYLESVGKAFQTKGVTASSMVREGHAPDQILEYAEANRIDLIAMSSHGRSDLGRWVFGSVTDKILHAGNTAVFIARAGKV